MIREWSPGNPPKWPQDSKPRPPAASPYCFALNIKVVTAPLIGKEVLYLFFGTANGSFLLWQFGIPGYQPATPTRH